MSVKRKMGKPSSKFIQEVSLSKISIIVAKSYELADWINYNDANRGRRALKSTLSKAFGPPSATKIQVGLDTSRLGAIIDSSSQRGTG